LGLVLLESRLRGEQGTWAGKRPKLANGFYGSHSPSETSKKNPRVDLKQQLHTINEDMPGEHLYNLLCFIARCLISFVPVQKIYFMPEWFLWKLKLDVEN